MQHPTGTDGRFTVTGVPNVPLTVMAWFRHPPDAVDRTIRFPAKVDAEPGDKDVRIILDPKLQLSRPK